MIYLDNAATTYPKPPQVVRAVSASFQRFGANPGRAGHSMSMAAAEEIYRCRSEIAEFFNAPGPECVAFTLNCTQAINFVLKGLLKQGEHVVTSNLEHNAVMRPLQALAAKGISYSEAQVFPGDNDATVDSFRQAMRPNTRLIVCTHASNVWGVRLPVERIAALGHQYNVPICLDCAQSAGVLPVDMGEHHYDYICCAGHKGLYGPMGIGLLITEQGASLSTIIEGGTGTSSASLEQPETMPDRMESGTQNMPAICGMRAGLAFVKSRGIERIYSHEISLVRSLHASLSKIEGVHLYLPEPAAPHFAPVLSFNVKELESETVSQKLSEQGIAVRAGLHCAPRAHECFHTMQVGAVRVCPSAFSTMNEMRAVSLAAARIAAK